MKTNKIFIILTILSLLLLSSCRKENIRDIEDEVIEKGETIEEENIVEEPINKRRNTISIERNICIRK